MWLRELGLFWKILIGSVAGILLCFLILTVFTGVRDGKDGGTVLQTDTTADLTETNRVLKSGKEEDKKVAFDVAEEVTKKSPLKEDMKTFLKDYDTEIVNEDTSLRDGLYVFYNKDLKSKDVIKEKVDAYIKEKKGYPVIVYYMNEESSGTAGLTLLARMLEDSSVWQTHDHPVAVFVKNGQLQHVYKQGDTLSDLPRDYTR
ncbi:hypothetical protein CN495_07925 [Bacillus thuringiensis]|uniref:Uncharacterized protein n=1 Tax=Bacillus thuringiensis TaxID=1428 RepID=A0ABD6SN70_BACTU|nr:hypothetical protein [Bacillus thuringiensis]PER55672.1 hypothetical protein CN495_07925 [Bacillus thuringiensis]